MTHSGAVTAAAILICVVIGVLIFLVKPFSVFNPFYPISLFFDFTSYLAPPVMSYECNVALNGVETSLWNHQTLLGTSQLCCQSMRRLFMYTIAGIAKISLIFQPFTSVTFSLDTPLLLFSRSITFYNC